LSIETGSQVVYRTLAGRNLFNGIINKGSAKIKQCERVAGKPVKYKIKFTAVVEAPLKEGETKKAYAVEHLEAKFLRQADMENFETIYSGLFN
jgi:S-ribosylhomocysteine lyase LuxS involved in autoinducer biosynthesis